MWSVDCMLDNNIQEILVIETSNIRKYIYDLEGLFSKYSSLSENINPEKAMKEFPNDWPEYIIPPKSEQIREKCARKYELKSIALKDSFFRVKKVLQDSEKFLSHSNKNDLKQIVKSIEKIEMSPLFRAGLKENNGRDYDKNIKLFEGLTGISSAKIQIDGIISSIGSLSFESKEYPVFSDDNIVQKIKDWIVQYFIYWIFFLIFTLGLVIIGIKPELL